MKLKTRHALLLLVIVGLMFSAELCSGAGFALYEASARGNALGGTLVGRADDPSALFFNPAGITQLPGTQMMAGATFIMPTTDVTTRTPQGTTTTTAEDNVWFPPHFYLTYQATDVVWLGLAVFSPFGLGTEFNENWPGAYNSYKAVIQTININPNIAFKLNDKVSLAAGLDIMYFDLTLKRKIPTYFPQFGLKLASSPVDRSLEGDSTGIGFNLGIHYKATDWLKLGASYRSQVQQALSGAATFVKPADFSPAFSSFFNNSSVRGTVTLPDELYLGAAIYPMKDLSIELGAVWTRWSTYDALTVEYGAAPIPAAALPPVLRALLFPGGSSDTVITEPKNWHDVWRLSVGVEYKATDWLDLRAGFTWDEEPVYNDYADYLVPANDRFLFSVGPGFRWRNWTLDLSYTYLYIQDRNNVPAHGSLLSPVWNSDFTNGHANLIGCSIGYKF